MSIYIFFSVGTKNQEWVTRTRRLDVNKADHNVFVADSRIHACYCGSNSTLVVWEAEQGLWSPPLRCGHCLSWILGFFQLVMKHLVNAWLELSYFSFAQPMDQPRLRFMGALLYCALCCAFVSLVFWHIWTPLHETFLSCTVRYQYNYSNKGILRYFIWGDNNHKGNNKDNIIKEITANDDKKQDMNL